MMATVTHVTSGLGLRKFQADGFLLTRVYMWLDSDPTYTQFLLTTICCFCVTPPLCVKKKIQARVFHQEYSVNSTYYWILIYN